MNAADRTFAPSDKNIKISDSATSISDNIDNLIANKDKIKTIDSSDDKPISLTAQQLNALKGKFGADETLKVSALTAGEKLDMSDGKYIYSFDLNVQHAKTTWRIENFGADDKLDFSGVFTDTKIGLGEFDLKKQMYNPRALMDNKIYGATLSYAPAGRGNSKDGEIKAFKDAFITKISKNAKELLIVKNTKDKYNNDKYIYAIENDDNIQIEQSEIKLLGVVSSDIDITPDNIIL